MSKVSEFLRPVYLIGLLLFTTSCLSGFEEKGFSVTMDKVRYKVGESVTLNIRNGATETIYFMPGCSTSNATAGLLREFGANNQFNMPPPPVACPEIAPVQIAIKPGKAIKHVELADAAGEFRYRIFFRVMRNNQLVTTEPFFYSTIFFVDP
jgi:hypothetical protein